MMLRRIAIISAVLLLLTFALQGCTPGYLFSIQLSKVAGKPYLIADYSNASDGETCFALFAPKSDDWSKWEPVATDLLGRTYATFIAQPKAADKAAEGSEKPPATSEKPADGAEHTQPPPPGERLGVFHAKRLTYFDLSTRPITQAFETLPFDWLVETTATYGGAVYAFGVSSSVYEASQREGYLKAARYDGQKWEELKVSGPVIRQQESKYGFWMSAVATSDGVRVFWRDYDEDLVIAPSVDGPRFVTFGKLLMTRFDGEGFASNVASLGNLPRGNLTAWVDGDQIKFLMQTRHKTEDAISKNGPLEIWQFDAKAETIARTETLEDSKQRVGLLSFVAAEHYGADGQEFIVRYNPQMIEIWKRTPDSPWSRVVTRPAGLPVYDLETPLLTGLGLALAAIIFGIGLAYHRARRALLLIRTIRSQDVYASLGVRSGAYVLDLVIVLSLTCLLGRAQGWPFVSPLAMLDFIQTQHWPFFCVYMLYMTNSEWLFGASVGKLLMGLRVVSEDGERITLWAAMVRNLMGFFERLPYAFMLVTFWMIILNPRRQRIGDVLSRSFVVHQGALQALKRRRAAAVKSGEVPSPGDVLLPQTGTTIWSQKVARRGNDSDDDSGKGQDR